MPPFPLCIAQLFPRKCDCRLAPSVLPSQLSQPESPADPAALLCRDKSYHHPFPLWRVLPFFFPKDLHKPPLTIEYRTVFVTWISNALQNILSEAPSKHQGAQETHSVPCFWVTFPCSEWVKREWGENCQFSGTGALHTPCTKKRVRIKLPWIATTCTKRAKY